jgi:hypothetical protein
MSFNIPTKNFLFRDRMRTTNNILGDCYAAAVVEKWSQDELQKMDNKESSSTCKENQDMPLEDILLQKLNDVAIQ